MVTCAYDMCREAELSSFSLEKAKGNPYRCLNSWGMQRRLARFFLEVDKNS